MCDMCGKIYQIPYNRYIQNLNNFGKTVCYECSRLIISKNRWNKNATERQYKAFDMVNKICKDYGYELLTQLDDITDTNTRIKYICPIHGEHEMTINNLKSGKRCPDCAYDRKKKIFRLSNDEILRRIEECGGTLLNLEEYINNSTRNLKITCPRCGEPFVTSFVLFTQHGGQLCQDCYRKESVGERKVREYLESHNIVYEPQKWFSDCRDVNPLPFDFYIQDINTAIEFDGIQHSRDGGQFFHKSYDFKKTIYHDKIKTNYCNNKGIKLIRIPYTSINHISEILNKELNYSHEDIV